MEKGLNFVLMSDANYVWQLTVAISGVLRACQNRDCVIHVLDCGISERDWCELESHVRGVSERFGRVCRMRRHGIDVERLSIQRDYNGTVATYSRLFIPELLSDACYCIYVDCDVLLIDDPSAEFDLFRKSGKMVGGHVDVDETRRREKDYCRKRSLPYTDEEYLCGGLLFMDLVALRRCRFTERAFDFLQRHKDCQFADQTAINCLCNGSVYVCSPGWSAVACECYGDLTVVHAVHYAGASPWKRIPSWYEFAAASAVVDLWYLQCQVAFGQMNVRRTYNTCFEDFCKTVEAWAICALSGLVVLFCPNTSRWMRLRRYLVTCGNDVAVRSARTRMLQQASARRLERT